MPEAYNGFCYSMGVWWFWYIFKVFVVKCMIIIIYMHIVVTTNLCAADIIIVVVANGTAVEKVKGLIQKWSVWSFRP